MDGRTPSSARIYAGWIFAAILVFQTMIISVLCWKILKLETSATNAPALATTYTSVLKTFFVIALLFDVGTALSLYGINVWKYIAAIRTGQAVKDDDGQGPVPTPSQVVAVVTGKPEPPAPVVPPPAPGGDDDVSPSRVD